MEEIDVRRTLKIWAILVISALAITSATAIGFVNSGLYSGSIYVQCEFHNGVSNNMSNAYLYIDGSKVAERSIGSGDYFYNDQIWFSPVDVKVGKTHSVQVRDDQGGFSETKYARVGFHETQTVNVSIGNISKVFISVSPPTPDADLTNKTVLLFVDGTLVDSQTFTNYYGYYEPLQFTQYLEMGSWYQIKATCGDREAVDDVMVDEYYENLSMYV